MTFVHLNLLWAFLPLVLLTNPPHSFSLTLDSMITRYMSWRYTNCCSGRAHSGRIGSRSSRNAYTPTPSCRRLKIPQIASVRTAPLNTSP